MSDAFRLPPLAEDSVPEGKSSVSSHRPPSWFQLDQINDLEWANGLTHAVGCLLSVVGSWLLLQQVAIRGTPAQLAACLAFCLSMIGVYAASTLSHWTRTTSWRQRFRQWDQGLIYLLIVGTYTPLAVVCLDGWWHLVTVVMWALALAGFVSKIALSHRVDCAAVGLYLALGWLPVVIVPRFLAICPPVALGLTVAGGLAYSLGTALLANDYRSPLLHTAWHLAVMLGSACHFWAVWQCLVPTG